eukprot:163346-Chlamydomonas_euryale.AAC.3
MEEGPVCVRVCQRFFRQVPKDSLGGLGRSGRLADREDRWSDGGIAPRKGRRLAKYGSWAGGGGVAAKAAGRQRRLGKRRWTRRGRIARK